VRRPRDGFTIIETLGMIAMLGLFILAASQLFVASLRVFKSAERMQEDASAHEAIARKLGRDAWGATRIETPDAHTAVLVQSGGSRIVWTLPREGGTILRTQTRPDGGAEESPVRASSEPFGFAAEGGSLVLRPLREGSLIATERRFPSQILRAELPEGGRP
jgi:hypothetical protein